MLVLVNLAPFLRGLSRQSFFLWPMELVGSDVGVGEFGAFFARSFQAVLLLVAHGAAVLARALPKLGGYFCVAGYSPVVPLVVAAVVLGLLRLTALMLE